MINAILERTFMDNRVTIGTLTMRYEDKVIFSCKTLEPKWDGNKKNVSCIPPGEYAVETYSSSKYPNVYEVQNVPGRSKILFHAGNYYSNTEGCILVGEKIGDINGDGVVDVNNSNVTLSAMKEATRYYGFNLTIIDSTYKNKI